MVGLKRENKSLIIKLNPPCPASRATPIRTQSPLPPLEGLPGLREFQNGQATADRRWLAHRTGWE